MRRLPRRVTLFLIALCFVPSLSAAPEWMADLFDESWNRRELRDWVEGEADLSDDLDARMEIATARIAQKESIYRGIESGRVSLVEAIRQFRAWGVPKPDDGAGPLEPLRVGSDDEFVAMLVIRGVRGRALDGAPSEINLPARLEAEFEHQFGHWPPK